MPRSQVHQRGPVSPRMDMTPLIDVTFQLIIFFLLVNNIISQDAVSMVVPILENPEIELIPEDNTIYVNLVLADDKEAERKAEPGYLNISGRIKEVQVGPLERFGKHEMDRVTLALKSARRASPDIRVLVRGDAGLLYSEVKPVLAAIAAAEVPAISLIAFREPLPDVQ